MSECSFYAVNGKHCVINKWCMVCKEAAPCELNKGDEIELTDFTDLAGTYRIVEINESKLRLEFLK